MIGGNNIRDHDVVGLMKLLLITTKTKELPDTHNDEGKGLIS